MHSTVIGTIVTLLLAAAIVYVAYRKAKKLPPFQDDGF